MNRGIRLGGRNFSDFSQSLDVDQLEYISGHLRFARVLNAGCGLEDFTCAKGLSADDVITEILSSGRAKFILAGCLTEERMLWTREEADTNAARFGRITNASEKAAMQRCLAEFVSFFLKEQK